MPAVQKERAESVKKPTWTMDVMILANMNEISKSIDDSSMKVDSGDTAALLLWKAGLRQFYRNIKSFLSEEDIETAEKGFRLLDALASPTTRTLPRTAGEIRRMYEILSLLNEMVYHARNELFMKFIEMMDPREKSANYAFSALPKVDRDRKVEEAKNGGSEA